MNKNVYKGIALALFAVIIWSGNFIAARGVIKQVPPASLAFFRWLTASIVIFPFAIKAVTRDWRAIKQSAHYLFWVALTGIALFNTLVYIGAHYISAINLALIGTTSSPIFSIILARIFLNERLNAWKLSGMILCIIGVIYLISRGNLENLFHLRFSEGDGWVLLAGFIFAIYNTLVKKKPKTISPIAFLSFVFTLGTILLIPFFLWEHSTSQAINWDIHLIEIILFLGIGASVIAFLCWNYAVGYLGAGRTALFGNLIPVFSSIEAALILNESFTTVHVIGMILVFGGIVLANSRQKG